MKLKNKLKYWRHQKMMTQTEFAAFLGVAYPTYNTWENQTRQPGLATALHIATMLRCTVNDIFFLEP